MIGRSPTALFAVARPAGLALGPALGLALALALPLGGCTPAYIAREDAGRAWDHFMRYEFDAATRGYDKALGRLEEAYGENHPERRRIAVQAAHQALQAGDLDRAAALAGPEARRAPPHVGALRILARVAEERGDLPLARGLLDRAEDVCLQWPSQPRSAETCHAQALDLRLQMLWRNGHYAQAFELGERRLATDIAAFSDRGSRRILGDLAAESGAYGRLSRTFRDNLEAWLDEQRPGQASQAAGHGPLSGGLLLSWPGARQSSFVGPRALDQYIEVLDRCAMDEAARAMRTLRWQAFEQSPWTLEGLIAHADEERANDSTPNWVWNSHLAAGLMAAALGRPDLALVYTRRGFEALDGAWQRTGRPERRDRVSDYTRAALALAQMELDAGHLPNATQAAAAATIAAETYTNPRHRARLDGRLMLGRIALAAGRTAEARAEASIYLEAAKRMRPPGHVDYAPGLLLLAEAEEADRNTGAALVHRGRAREAMEACVVDDSSDLVLAPRSATPRPSGVVVLHPPPAVDN